MVIILLIPAESPSFCCQAYLWNEASITKKVVNLTVSYQLDSDTQKDKTGYEKWLDSNSSKSLMTRPTA